MNPSKQNPNRLAALDGVRGVAILLVLVDHGAFAVLGHAPAWSLGQHGVALFFVLSGFLITCGLAENPRLGQFYARRCFRLMPAAWAYIAAMALLTYWTGAHFVSATGVAACLLFFRNFVSNAGNVATGHFWSLSIEEQFYLVWPALLLLFGNRRSRWAALLLAIGAAGFRFAHPAMDMRSTFGRADGLLLGCVAGLLFTDSTVRTRLSRYVNLLLAPALVTAAACVSLFHGVPPLVENAAFAALILALGLAPQAPVARILSAPALVWFGRLSYSLYLWQQPFTLAGNLPLFLVGVPLAAMASYHLIELPGLRLHRMLIEVPASKPLPAGTRFVLTCTCGRVIPRRERFELTDPRQCPDCGSTLRMWERCPAGPIDRLVARIRLQQWNRARAQREVTNA